MIIILHFNLQQQYNMNFIIIYSTSFHCTGRYELNKLTSLPKCGFTAQFVEHRTGIAEVTGSNPVEGLMFFRLLPSSCWKFYCDYHSSLSSTTAVHYELYVFHIKYLMASALRQPIFVSVNLWWDFKTILVRKRSKRNQLPLPSSLFSENSIAHRKRNETEQWCTYTNDTLEKCHQKEKIL